MIFGAFTLICVHDLLTWIYARELTETRYSFVAQGQSYCRDDDVEQQPSWQTVLKVICKQYMCVINTSRWAA